MQTTYQVVDPACCNADSLGKMYYLYNSSMTAVGVTTAFWEEFRPGTINLVTKAHGPECHRPWGKGETTKIIFLNGYIVELSSKYLCLYL